MEVEGKSVWVALNGTRGVYSTSTAARVAGSSPVVDIKQFVVFVNKKPFTMSS